MARTHERAQADTDRLLTTLERLLELEATQLRPTLDQASQLVAEALDADKVDSFLYEAASESLVALGTSATPLARRQVAIGMDRQPLANGGRSVEVFQNGVSYLEGHLDADTQELRGVTHGLGVRSKVACALVVDGERRGVLEADSVQEDRFDARDLRFLEAVARWVGMVTHRAELVEQMTAEAHARGLEAGAGQLIGLLTPRQREIGALIAAGLTNEQIGRRLTISGGSVANHVRRILERLDANRRSQIATWITERGLPETDGQQNGSA